VVFISSQWSLFSVSGLYFLSVVFISASDLYFQSLVFIFSQWSLFSVSGLSVLSVSGLYFSAVFNYYTNCIETVLAFLFIYTQL